MDSLKSSIRKWRFHLPWQALVSFSVCHSVAYVSTSSAIFFFTCVIYHLNYMFIQFTSNKRTERKKKSKGGGEAGEGRWRKHGYICKWVEVAALRPIKCNHYVTKKIALTDPKLQTLKNHTHTHERCPEHGTLWIWENHISCTLKYIYVIDGFSFGLSSIATHSSHFGFSVWFLLVLIVFKYKTKTIPLKHENRQEIRTCCAAQAHNGR